MSKTIGKYKVGGKDKALSAVDGATISGNLDGIGTLGTSGLITGGAGLTLTTSTLTGGRKPISALSNTSEIDVTITEAVYPSGTTFVLDLDSNTNTATLTLPALTAGLEYNVLVGTTAGSDVTLAITAPSAVLNGAAVCDDNTEDIVGTTFTIAATKAIKGTQMRLISDGVLWYIKAVCLCDVGDVSTT